MREATRACVDRAVQCLIYRTKFYFFDIFKFVSLFLTAIKPKSIRFLHLVVNSKEIDGVISTWRLHKQHEKTSENFN